MIKDDSYIKYCLLNELNLKRINLPKDPIKTELHKNEAQFSFCNGVLTLERRNESLDNLRLNFFTSFTSQVVNHFSLKDLNFKFIVNFNDGPENDALETRLCFARPKDSPHICIPDSHLSRTASICNSLSSIDKPFEEKINKASFFGSDTGRKDKDGSVQRVNFCKKYKNSENVIAKITNFIEQPFDQTIYSSPASIVDQLNYKYILNINGNTTSWERLIWAMKSNSFCLFVRPPQYQNEISWYYHMFDLCQSFIYVDEDSIENFIEWASFHQNDIDYLKQNQKNMANTLAKIEVHAYYLSYILLNYNHIYNESSKLS